LTARVGRLWVKTAHGAPMEARDRLMLVAGSGVDGAVSAHRHVTVISAERWDATVAALGAEVDPSARRANVLLSGVDLRDSAGKVLRIGACRVRLRGETKPCATMDEAHMGLRAALEGDWGGGAWGEVLDGGEIAVGDAVSLESTQS